LGNKYSEMNLSVGAQLPYFAFAMQSTPQLLNCPAIQLPDSTAENGEFISTVQSPFTV